MNLRPMSILSLSFWTPRTSPTSPGAECREHGSTEYSMEYTEQPRIRKPHVARGTVAVLLPVEGTSHDPTLGVESSRKTT